VYRQMDGLDHSAVLTAAGALAGAIREFFGLGE